MKYLPPTVFMGSPEFSLPALRRLAQAFPVVGVITQPDRPAGRGRKPTSPPVKILAQDLGLPILQPARLRDAEAMAQLKKWAPDLIVVAAFGQILRPEVLDLPAYGCVNVHASLLPRWRGAAPIQAALLHGDAITGVTIMRMDAGVDTGPLIAQKQIHILPQDTAGTLSVRLAEAGADLLMESLPPYLEGSLAPQPQDDRLATYAPLLRKEDGELDLNRSAEELERRVRAFNPWPGAWLTWQEKPLKVLRARALVSPGVFNLKPGDRVIMDGFPAVSASPGLLVLEEVQPPGKKPMSGRAFLAGGRHWD